MTEMEPIQIRHTIEKSREGTYYSLPFTVPEGVGQLTVHYRYSKESGNVVDLGLSDEQNRFLGWSGSARDTVTISAHESTPGYRMTEIRSGIWHLLVGAYKIPDRGLEVDYEISFSAPGFRWYAGDLHLHSTASDGQHSVYDLALRAKKKGLDFIAVADHNNTCENEHLPVIPGITLIPAVEWTHYQGHMNFFGVKSPFENSFIANSKEEMQSLIRQVKERGALVSVNHPKCPFCPYLWEDETAFDLVEIWNGPMRKANLDAYDWWRKMLLEGRKIPIVGGSDFHRDLSPVRLGNPVTWVYAKSPRAEDLCEAISRGHSFVTSSVTGVQLGIRNDGIMFGDTVPSENGRTWNFCTEGLRPGMQLRLVTDREETILTTVSDGSRRATATAMENSWKFAFLTVTLPLKNRLWIRAVSNPVYFE